MSIVGESRLRRSLREADAGGKKVWPLGEKVAGARVPGGHTKRHTVRARGSHQMPHRGMRSVPRGHTKRHTGQGGSSAGRAQAGARDQDAGSGSGGGSLEEASDSEDGRGPGTAQKRQASGSHARCATRSCEQRREICDGALRCAGVLEVDLRISRRSLQIRSVLHSLRQRQPLLRLV